MTLEEFIRKYQINLTNNNLKRLHQLRCQPFFAGTMPGSGKTTVFSIQIGLYDILQKT